MFSNTLLEKIFPPVCAPRHAPLDLILKIAKLYFAAELRGIFSTAATYEFI